MILGRPVNQWVGLITAAASLVQVLVVTLVPTVDPVTVAVLIGAVTGFLGVLIAFVAGQPPSINVGDPYTVVTPAPQPNVEKVANAFPTPPANLVAK
jgi:predicted ABC-type sugar transport system permease subunit